MNAHILIRSVVVIVLAGGLSGCGKSNTFVAPPAPKVTVQYVEQRDVTIFFPFSGKAEASESLDIRARVPGFLESVEFKDGGLVQKGQTLFKIEPDQYNAALKTARAQLAQAQASQELASATHKRMKDAFRTDAVAEVDVLAAEAELHSTEAAIRAGEAAVEQAELSLSYTIISAPLSGKIARHFVSAGNLVGGAESTLLTGIIVDDPIFVYFDVDERSLLKIGGRSGDEGGDLSSVWVELADGQRYEYKGQLDYMAPSLDSDTGTIRVRAVFENPEGVLVPGMFTRVLVPKEIPSALLVPDSAIQRDITGSYVFTVNDADVVQVNHVVTGQRLDGMRIIKEGLSVEDRIIIMGIQRARPGITVQAKEVGENDAQKKGGE